MEKYAWKGLVKEGKMDEYIKRQKGIDFAAKYQAESPVVDKWNEYMKHILIMEMDPETGAQPKLRKVFTLD